MTIGKVVGSIVSTIKHESFDRQKILLVAPTDNNENIVGNTIVAVDAVQAGVGDMVIVAAEGKSATEILEYEYRIPIRSVIVGIIDKVDTN